VIHYKKKYAAVVVGPAGVGKGYAFGNVMREYHWATIFCTGDWCRENKKTVAAAGTLVADDLIVAAIKLNYIGRGRPDRYLIDCPRSIKQLEDLRKFFVEDQDIASENLIGFEMRASRDNCRLRLLERAQRQARADDVDISVMERRLDAYFGNEGIQQLVVPQLARYFTQHIVIPSDISLEDISRSVRNHFGPLAFGSTTPVSV
jgi:adenylate kinase family enzyme